MPESAAAAGSMSSPTPTDDAAGPRPPAGILRLLAPLLLLAACRFDPPPEPGDRRLLESFEAVVERGVAAGLTLELDGRERLLTTAAANRVSVARSERQALVTTAGVVWQTAEEEALGGTLAVSLAALGAADEGATAVIELRAGGARREILRTAVRPGAWSRHRLALPQESGRLALTSEGPSPVAWAEIHALRSPGRRAARRPDLVLISIDTLRADHLSTYGYPRPTSPHLDRLAAESYLFTRSLSASTWTLPSTATLLTGLLPAQHGLLSIHRRLTPDADTLAERLARLGYRTAAITDGGFVDTHWGFSQGFERYDATAGEPWEPKDVAEIADPASRWLEENRFHPFFLFVHTYETHQPYVNRESFADPFLDPGYAGPFAERASVHVSEAAATVGADLERIVALYDGEIRRADHYLGRFLDSLRAAGRWRDTAVIVTSDHGEEFLDHGDFDHGFAKVFDPNVRVPLILKPPGGLAAGRTVDRPVTGLDVAPTLLQLAGDGGAASLPGRPLLAAGSPGPPADRAVLVHGTNSFPHLDEERYRLDSGNRAVVFDRVRGRAEWYDLTADPEMRRPRGEVFAGPAAGLADRLQATLAWSGNAELLARLPADARRLVVPRNSRIEPLGVWSGLAWRPGRRLANGRWRIRLEPGRPHDLVFSPRRGEGGWRLLVERAGAGGPEILMLEARGSLRRKVPLSGPPPAPGVIFPSARLFPTAAAELPDANREELEALGYLQ